MAGEGTPREAAKRGIDPRALPWIYGVSLVVIVAFALFPVGLVAVAGVIADSAGCRVNEAGANPCVIAGVDFGRALYTMLVLGWLMLVTIPAGGFLLAAWVVALLVHLAVIVFRRRRAA